MFAKDEFATIEILLTLVTENTKSRLWCPGRRNKVVADSLSSLVLLANCERVKQCSDRQWTLIGELVGLMYMTSLPSSSRNSELKLLVDSTNSRIKQHDFMFALTYFINSDKYIMHAT